MEPNEIILIFTPLIYYSAFDEAAFFEWLNKIKCIKSYKGILRELHVIVNSTIDKQDYREFKALFRRYGYDLNQLRVFKEHFKEADLNIIKRDNFPFLHEKK